MKQVFITGGTGYMGSRLIKLLVEKGHSVKALVRSGSEHKLQSVCDCVIADPFNADSFAEAIPAGSTFVQLLGVPHPGPKKRQLFKTIDLASARASAQAAKQAKVGHFVYVSVAQTPTKIMHDYQQCRAEGEACVLATGVPATFIRPWYVVGPGHYWPLLFLPLFNVLEYIPATAEKAKSLRLVSLKQMLQTLLYVVEHPPTNLIDIIEIDRIRSMN